MLQGRKKCLGNSKRRRRRRRRERQVGVFRAELSRRKVGPKWRWMAEGDGIGGCQRPGKALGGVCEKDATQTMLTTTPEKTPWTKTRILLISMFAVFWSTLYHTRKSEPIHINCHGFITLSFSLSIYICIYIRGSLNTFLDFLRKGTFIDSTQMKLYSPSK